MTRPIRDLDVTRDRLERQVREAVARQREQRAEESAQRLRGLLAPSADPLVGLNPTGRVRRPSAPSRRKHARRTAIEETS